MAMRVRSPPSAAVPGEEQRLRLERHRVDDETAAWPERRDRRVDDRRDRSRRRRRRSRPAGQGRGALPARGRRTIARPGHAERRGIPARCAPRGRRGLDGDGAQRAVGEHPFDATEPEPAPMSQSSSPRRGARLDSVTARTSRLVIWPSCSNSSSGKPGTRGRSSARPAPATTSMATRLSGVDPLEVEAGGRGRAGCARAVPRAPRALVSREAPKPEPASEPGERLGASSSEVSARMRAPGWRCGRMRSSGTAMQREERRLGQRPAEPRRRQAEGRRRRGRRSLLGRIAGRAAGRCRSGTGRPRRARRPAGRAARAPRRPPGRTGSTKAGPRRGSAAPPGPDGACRRRRFRRIR